MKKLLNLKKKSLFVNEELLNSQEVRLLRQYLIKSAVLSPQYIYDFCLFFQKVNKQKLIELSNKVLSDEAIKNFIINQDKFWMDIILKLDFDYNRIFDEIFGKDRIYEHLGIKIVDTTRCSSLYYIYYVVNYIEDNFPIKRNKELNEEEKRLIKFLLFKGGTDAYIKKYNVSKEKVNELIASICVNYNSENINKVLNLIFIEKYMRNKNNHFLNTIKHLQEL